MGIREYVLYIAIIVIAFVMVYFPRKRQEKVLKEMQDKLKQGDKILTFSGLSGTIESIENDKVVVLLNPDKVKVQIEKWAIAGLDETK